MTEPDCRPLVALAKAYERAHERFALASTTGGFLDACEAARPHARDLPQLGLLELPITTGNTDDQ
jgi:hypothetical protein